MLNRLIAAVVTPLVRLARREPAVVIGTVITALAEAQQIAVDHHAADWRTLLPLLGAAAIRQVVTSPATRDRLEDQVLRDIFHLDQH